MQIRVQIRELQHLRQDVAQGRQVEVAFAREIVVEQPLRHSGGGGDVLNGNRIIGVSGKEALTHRENVLGARLPRQPHPPPLPNGRCRRFSGGYQCNSLSVISFHVYHEHSRDSSIIMLLFPCPHRLREAVISVLPGHRSATSAAEEAPADALVSDNGQPIT